MASVLHGSARTTPRIRAELQASKESARSLPARYDLNPKTVRKWRQRTATADAPMGPKAPKSTVLTPAEEAVVVAFRQKTLLPLDDVLGCLREHSQSQPKRPAPLPPAAWDLQAAEGRGQRQAQPVQELPDRLWGTVTRTEFGRAQFAIPSSGSGRGGGSPRPQRFVSEDAERVAGCEMALDVECVVDSGVNRQEALG
jgi:hypothetical protein